MRKERMLVTAAWVLLAAVLVSSLMVLCGGGKLHLVDGESYAMLSRYAKLDSIRKILVKNYYRESDETALLDGAASGMLAALGDPYSFYYTPEQMERHGDSIAGVYDGVGLLLLANDAGEAEVIRVYEGSPAAAAGIAPGDVIAAVDGASVDFESAARLLKGEAGTRIELSIRRDGVLHSLALTRESVHYSNIASSMLPGNIGYIAICQFTGDDVTGFSSALRSLTDAGMRALIIDLRNNPGGLLEDVAAIADEILPESLIVYTEDRQGRREEYCATGAYCDLPLALLVNGMSASASEILAAAVQDLDRGAVLGTQTYGKGVVQALVRFPEDGSGMQYTASEYFSPLGRSIHGVGVTPDFIVEAGESLRYLSGIPDPEGDPQLRAAINWLNQQTGE